jgi:hypothetical protein
MSNGRLNLILDERDTTGIVLERATTHERLGPDKLIVLHQQLVDNPQLLVDRFSDLGDS